MREFIEKNNDIYYIRYKPVMDEENIKKYIKELTDLVQNSAEKVRLITDMSSLESDLTSAHRKQIAEGIKPLEYNIYKSAVVGFRNAMVRAVASITITFSGRRNIQIFANEQDALKWLRE